MIKSSINTSLKRPELFTNGFLDVVNNGQVNASARLIRLFIGEPEGFILPISIYGGVSANNFSDVGLYNLNSGNETLTNNFLNPLSGLVNACFDNVKLAGRKSGLTKFGLIYQFGERVLTGFKSMGFGYYNMQAVNFLNTYALGGLYFQTGAWDRGEGRNAGTVGTIGSEANAWYAAQAENSGNGVKAADPTHGGNAGTFWFAARYIACYTNREQLLNIMPDFKPNGWFHGYSLGWGIEISRVINLKLVFYKYINQREKEYRLPIYQFSFNYSFKN